MLFLLFVLFISDDHSRVRLLRNDIDYINASLVMLPEANRAYILTQVVDNSQMTSFWASFYAKR